MSDDEIRTRVQGVLQKYLTKRGRAEINDFTNLHALGIDSLAITELVFNIAEEFGMDDRNIDDNALRAIRSIDDLVRVVSDALGTSPPHRVGT